MPSPSAPSFPPWRAAPPVGAWRARRRYSCLLGHAMQRRPAQLLFCAPPAIARSGLHVRSGARLQPCHGRALGREGMQFPAMPFVRPACERPMPAMRDPASPRRTPYVKVGSTFPSDHSCDAAVSVLLYVLSAQEQQDKRRRRRIVGRAKETQGHCEARGRGAARARAKRKEKRPVTSKLASRQAGWRGPAENSSDSARPLLLTRLGVRKLLQLLCWVGCRFGVAAMTKRKQNNDSLPSGSVRSRVIRDSSHVLQDTPGKRVDL